MSTEAMRAALAALSNEDMSPAQAWELKQRAMTLLDAALAQRADEPVAELEAWRESRAMFVARLENMQEHGDKWLTVESVLALLNNCDMLASRGNTP